MTYERRQGWLFLEAWADGIRKWEAELVDARRDPSVDLCWGNTRRPHLVQYSSMLFALRILSYATSYWCSTTRILRSAIKEFDCIPECLPAARVHEDKASRSSVYRFERRAHQSRVGYSRAVRIDKKDSKGRATYAQRVPYRRDQWLSVTVCRGNTSSGLR